MPYYRKNIYSGNCLEIEEIFSIRTVRTDKEFPEILQRSSNENTTTEQQRDINIKNARKNLARMIRCNFDSNDFFITLSYRGKEPDYETAKKLFANFSRRLKYARMKKGLPPLKYIAVLEGKSKRKHHHLIINNGISKDEIKDIWGLGRVTISDLEPNDDYEALTKYITKESYDDELENKKAWTSSKNLKKPVIIRKRVKKYTNDMKAPKGYIMTMEPQLYITGSGFPLRYTRCVKIKRE